MNKKSKEKDNVVERHINVPAPNFQYARYKLIGTAPLVSNARSKTLLEVLTENQKKGTLVKSPKTKKPPKDFEKCYQESQHRAREGWAGIPAGGIRKALVRACCLTDATMIIAKMCITVKADGYDAVDNQPLVRITKGEPHMILAPLVVLPVSGLLDIHPRAMWDEGWEAMVELRYDADQFTAESVTNLLMRVGFQIGLMEGRNASPKSCGIGWGFFRIADKNE